MNITIDEAKTDLYHYILEAHAGKNLVICIKDIPVAELCPVKALSKEPRPIGVLKDVFQVPESFFEELPEEVMSSFCNCRYARIP